MNDVLFANDYSRSLNSLEKNLGRALHIEDIMNANTVYDLSKFGEGQICEVQYGFIDMDWINILNIFDKTPLNWVMRDNGIS
jgi:hypothetical protein